MNVTTPQELQLTIENLLGQEVFKEFFKQFSGVYKKQLNLKQYSKGIYQLHVKISHGTVARTVID